MNDIGTINIGIIIGSTRQGRFGDKPAQWMYEKVAATDGVAAELLDLREYPMPFFDEPISPAMTKEPYEHESVRRWSAVVGAQDAFIIATPEYNHGYPAVLKNALDYVYVPWNNKPIGFVSWGGVAGARSVEQLRLVSIELKMAPIRTGVHISRPWELIEEHGGLKPGALEPYDRAAAALIEELVWYADALKSARSK